MRTVTPQALAIVLLLFTGAMARSQDASSARAGCAWSSVWREVSGQFPPVPKGAKLTDAKRKKGSIDRPPSSVLHTIRGPWTVELVVDERGDVRDAKIVRVPAIDPPWPEYEEAILKSVKKWKYSPLRIDGRPWPNCMTVTVRDR